VASRVAAHLTEFLGDKIFDASDCSPTWRTVPSGCAKVLISSILTSSYGAILKPMLAPVIQRDAGRWAQKGFRSGTGWQRLRRKQYQEALRRRGGRYMASRKRAQETARMSAPAKIKESAHEGSGEVIAANARVAGGVAAARLTSSQLSAQTFA